MAYTICSFKPLQKTLLPIYYEVTFGEKNMDYKTMEEVQIKSGKRAGQTGIILDVDYYATPQAKYLISLNTGLKAWFSVSQITRAKK